MSMSFHYGNLLDFYRSQSTNRLVNVGLVTYLVGESTKTILVTCFSDTGSLFMDGKFAPADKSIGETLGWFIGEQIFEIDIEDLFFKSEKKPERPAYHWERGAFFMGRWKQYAKTGIHARVTIRVDDTEQNESVHIDIPDQAILPSYDNNNESSASPPSSSPSS
uniref:Uncharacterized protein n=1 Tax=viral metagenome TaxID=1070528 RepID=A0A6C0AIV7_9ZZZZ